MTSPPLDPTGAPRAPPAAWWARVHQALMPDYNRKATVYWWLMVTAGAAVLGVALNEVVALPAAQLSIALAGVALAMLAGVFPVQIPRWKNAYSAGEIFIFLLLLLIGPAAAALAAASEALLGSWRVSKRWTSRLASPAMAGIAMYGVGSALTQSLAMLERRALNDAGLTVLVTMLAAIVYFIAMALLTTATFHLKRSAWPTLHDLLGNFGWIGTTYAASALVASMLFLSAEQSGIGILLAAAPIIALLIVTLHYHFRQREVDEAARTTRLDAAEREAQLAAAHVAQLQASEQRFQSAFSHAAIGMALVSFDARILMANSALSDLLGFAQENELLDRPVSDFVEARNIMKMLAQMKRLQSGAMKSFAGEVKLRCATGNQPWASLHCSLFTQVDDDAPCLIIQVHDVTARREAERSLKHIAYHDSLTGLPNRHRFQQVLAQALDDARGRSGRPFGLMFLDFDRFKLINDSLGHAVGDEFLVAVAQRIQSQLRSGDAVARLGGDEFAILAVDLDSERYATGLANRLLEALRQPFRIANTDLTSSVSIGITFSGNGYESTSDMLRDADTAMYKAKAAGKARYALFDAALHTEVSHRLRLEGDLRQAVAAGQIDIDYQPIFDLNSGQVTGFEALARWQHPELGAVEPAIFIPVAEDAGLMVQLTDLMLPAACRQLRAWQQRFPRLASLNLHVNLSGIDLAHPNLVARVNQALAQAQLRPQDLTLELTENTLMRRLEGALPALTELRKSGVGLSIDDFGTGYSSLRHLSSLPVNGLKIAPGFVADLERGPNGAAILQSIVLMAGSLGKSIIAEGIESAEQLARLREAGCQAGQGYFLARPLSAKKVDRWLGGLDHEPGHVPAVCSESARALLH